MTCPICTAPNAESNISVLSFYPPPPATQQWVALPLCAECRDILKTLSDREIVVPRLTRAGVLVPD